MKRQVIQIEWAGRIAQHMLDGGDFSAPRSSSCIPGYRIGWAFRFIRYSCIVHPRKSLPNPEVQYNPNIWLISIKHSMKDFVIAMYGYILSFVYTIFPSIREQRRRKTFLLLHLIKPQNSGQPACSQVIILTELSNLIEVSELNEDTEKKQKFPFTFRSPVYFVFVMSCR
jgi:hypothetical protein